MHKSPESPQVFKERLAVIGESALLVAGMGALLLAHVPIQLMHLRDNLQTRRERPVEPDIIDL